MVPTAEVVDYLNRKTLLRQITQKKVAQEMLKLNERLKFELDPYSIASDVQPSWKSNVIGWLVRTTKKNAADNLMNCIQVQ